MDHDESESINLRHMQMLLQKGMSTNRTNITDETEN